MPPTRTVPDSVLCASCHSLFNSPRARWTDDHRAASKYRIRLEWHSDIESLRQSARDGCELCNNVLEEMTVKDLLGNDQEKWRFGTSIEADVTETTRPIAQFTTIEWDVSFMTLSPDDKLRSRVASSPFGIHHLRKSVDSIWDQEAVASLSLSDDNEIPTTRDISAATYWLDRCDHEHRACSKRVRKTDIMPSRLIHLYTQGNSTRARLVEAQDVSIGSTYATLSHCWGSGPLEVLKANNLATFKVDIMDTNLPRTFGHAFEVVLQLGFSFIWIDSLCIVQDSEDDWRTECRKMADVYENAAMNIAATAFVDSETGLYVTKVAKKPRTIRLEVDILSPPTIKHPKDPQHVLKGVYYLLHEDAWSIRVDQAPLNRRGWVLQERFFSPRILHFGKDQLLWECQQLQASETFASVCHPPIRSERTAGSRPYQTLVDYLTSRDSKAAAANTWEKKNTLELQTRQETMWIRDTWYGIVETYSKSQLTRTSDKLVAIGGITLKFQFLLDDQFISGLWLKSIMHDLLWYRAENKSRKTCRPSQSRAPSWSWACLDYHVTYSHRRYPPDLVFDDRVELLGHDDTAGILKIRAPILRRLTRDDYTRSGDWLQIIESRRENDMAIIRYDAISSDLGVSLEVSPAYYPYSIGTHEVYVLCLTREPYAAGLLLRRSGTRGHYSRIGYFGNVRDMRGLQGSSYNMVQDDYIDKHRGNVFTIALV